MFSLKIRTVYNIISPNEKEGRPDSEGSTGRPKKLTHRLLSSSGKNLGLTVSTKPSEMLLKNPNILQEWLGKNPCCQHEI